MDTGDLAAATESRHSPTEDNEELFRTVDDYPWLSDAEFQSGLLAILGDDPTPEERFRLTLRARCFYYSRKFGAAVDFAEYLEWSQRQPGQGPPPSNGSRSHLAEEQLASTGLAADTLRNDAACDPRKDVPYPRSFNEVVDLITLGKPIPGIRNIPDTLLEGQASEPTTARKKKPWE